MRNDDDRKWLYDTMQSKGVNTGNYDEFCKSLNNKEDRDWYYQKSLEFGLNVGTDKDFTDMMADNTNSPSNVFDNPLKKLRQFAERVGVPNGQSVPTNQAVPTGLPDSAQQNDVAQSVSTGQESQEEQQLSEVEALGRNRSGKQVVSIPETSYDTNTLNQKAYEDYVDYFNKTKRAYSPEGTEYSVREAVLEDIMRRGGYGDDGFNSPKATGIRNQAEERFMRQVSGDLATAIMNALPDGVNPRESLQDVFYSRDVQEYIGRLGETGLKYDRRIREFIQPAIQEAFKKKYGYDADFIAPRDWEVAKDRVLVREANKVVAPYLGKMVDDAFAVFDKKGAEAYRKVRSENEESSMFVNPEQQGGHILAGIFGAERAKIKASDPGKVREHLEQRVEQLYGDLVKNKNFQKDAIAKAEELGIPVMEYIQSYVLPGFADNLQKKFRETAVAREMPDSDLENILQGITRDSIFGMLFNKLLYSDEQREYQQEAMTKSDRGMWSNIGRMTAGMAADFWLWGGWGKIGAKAAQGIIKQRVASVAAKEGISEAAARVVVENEMKKFWTKEMIKNATPRLASSAVTLGGAGGATQPFVSGVLNGENPVDVIANTAAGFIGEVPVGLAFGLTGGMVHPLVERLTGIPKLFGKIGAYEVEAGTMYATGEMHKLLAGEAAFENPLEGMLESNISLAGIKLAQPHGVAKAWNSIRHPIRTTREAMQPSKEGYFTEDDIKSLESKTDSRNLLEVVKKLGSGEAVVREDVAEAATAYDTYMRDKDEPVSRKAKVANLFGKKAPVVGYEVSMEHFFDEDGNYIIRTRDMDGQCVNEYKFKNVEDGEAKETELKNTLYNNEVEALAERVNLWNGQRNLLSWQPQDEEMQRKVLTLNQHAEELVSIAEKQSSNEPLTTDEQKLLNTYWDALAGYVRDGGAYKTFERNYEKQKGLQEGTLEKILKKQSKDYSADERMVVDEYKEALRRELPENPTPALPEGEGDPTPTLYEGEGVTVAHDRQELFESGRRALLSADSEALRQIDMDVDVAAERVRRLQESGNADAEALSAAQEMLSLAEVRERGVRSGLQEMIESQQRAIAEELEPMKSERGMITPVTLHDGRQGFVKAGVIDVDNQYGSLFVTFERDGEWVTEQVSNNHIREVGESRSFDDMVSERSRVMEEETIARFQRISEGLDIEPGRQVSLTIGEVTAPFEVRGETSDGQVVLRDAAGEELAMPRSDVEAYLKATRAKEIEKRLNIENPTEGEPTEAENPTPTLPEGEGVKDSSDRPDDGGEPPVAGSLQVDMDRLKDMALDAVRKGEDVEALLNTPGVSEEMKEEVRKYLREEAGKRIHQSYQLSDEIDENGQQFVLTRDGHVEFGYIGEETGLTPAPILLSEGVITNPNTNAGYGLLHIEARHGEQIRAAGYNSVLDFIEEVAKNYEVIREGRSRDGLQTYMLQLTDRHNNTLMIELSGDGTYWNINTAGIFKTSYGANRNVVYNRHTTDNQSAETNEASLSGEQSGTTPLTRMNAPTQQADRSKFSLHPNTQIGEPVPLNDSNKLTLTDNQSALLGINSSELSASKDNENLSDVQENARESVEFIPGAVYDRDGNILLTGTDYEAEQHDRLSYINKARNLDDRYKRAKKTYNAFDATRGIIEDYVPRDVYELVSANLPYRSIEWESLKKELGDMSRGVGRDFDSNTFNMFLSKKGEGRSFNKVVHDIWESRNDYDGGGADTDLLGGIHSLTDQDVRNALLEMLMSYSRPSEIKNLMLDNRINEAERLLNGEARYQEDAAQGAFYEMYRMSPEEYVSYHEAERGEQSRLSDADIQEINRIFAEKYLEDETRNQSRETGSLSSMDQDAEGRGTEGGVRRGGEELRRHDSEGGNRQYPRASEGEGREPGNGMGVSSSKDDVSLEVGRGTSGGEVGKPTEAGSTENTGSPEDGSFADRLSSAIAETETNPSEGQKKSGNYKKGHLSFGGYDFTVENPKGSVRRGKDATGKSWEQTMNNTYGYLRGKGMLGKDGDHLDVFINDAADLDAFDGPIFIIDQVDNDGKFDEHKIMYGFDDMPSAIRNYLMNYERPWKGLGNITEVDKATFDKWLESSDRKLKPFAETRFGDNRDVVSKIMDVGKNPSPARPEGEGENQTGRTIPTSQTEGIGDSTLTRPEGVGNVETDGGAAASVVQSSAAKIEDFGEKIGMARKDTAVKGIKKGDGSGEPAWKKKYNLRNLADAEAGAPRMLNFDGLVVGEADYNKPFIAYYTKKAKSRWSSDRHYPIRDKDGNVMVFRSREEFDSVVPVWEVREQMYRIREKDGKFVITRTASNGKSVEYASFDTREEAEAYMTSPEGATSLLNHKRENFELPALERLTRVGMKDYRHGRNVSGQDMLDAFGFRGGEFGNWVNAAERQQFLNTAYDALMDLANLIGVSPRALSLNGELSIAFGARGSKGAKAHYEPSRAVINLTKMNGAGSLAHEFAHALDNYFGMLAKGVQREHGGENSHYVSEYTWSSDPKIRKEVLDVFKEIRDAMEHKTVTRKIDIDNATDTEKKLRTSLDKAIADARAEFERGITKYVYNRKTRKRETQKIVPTKEQLQRFDELMKSLEKDSQWEYVMGKEGFRLTGETADAFYDLVKDVLPNKKGKYGPAHNVGYYMSRWKDANDYLERAKSGESETVTVDTKFYSDSKRADAGRAGSYFSTTKELLARAFETYLADKMSDAGKSSDYLTYKKGDIFEQLFGINVYPATEEAQRLSGLFDKLFSTIEERVVEDTGNVALYEKVGERRPLTEYEVVAVQGLAEDMNKHGVPVVVDEASEKLVDEVNGGLRLSRGQKRTLETVSVSSEEEHLQTVVSSVAGAKVVKNLDTLSKNIEKLTQTPVKTFLGDVAKAIGAKKRGSNSQYATFETKNGKIVTIRLADHNASTIKFDNADVDDGISIVISPKKNVGVEKGGDAHIVEYYYNAIKLRKAEGKPLAEIVRSIQQSLYSGEYKDTTGLAEREEVNAEQIRLHKVYHGSGADFDAFDHRHIGEGEGNQSYGWGSYVTEVEGIGKTYATQGRGKFTYKGLSWEKLWHNEHDGKTMAALDVMERMENGMTFDDAVDDCIKSSKESAEYFNEVSKTEGGYKETAEHYRDKVKALEEIKAEDFSRKSNFLYTVEIPDDNGHNYLDWTKTIDKSDRRRIADVVRALEGEPAQSVMFGNYRDGWQSLANMIEKNQWAYQEIRDRLVQAMGGKLSDEQAVTALMRKAGFVGVKYPAEHMSGGRKDGAKNYVIFDESDLTITDKLRFFRTPNGEAYGFTLNGVIHIDPRIATSETPIHEYSHLWVDAMRKSNPEEWEHIKKMLRAERAGKLGEIWRQVSENYPELEGNDDALCEEILTHYSGKRGAERLEAEVRRVADSDASPLEKSTVIAGLRRLGEGIRRFWKWVADSFHIHYKDVDEVADRIMSDLAEGRNFKDVKEKESPVFYSNAERAVEGISQEKATPEQWLKMIEKGGGLKAGEDKWLGLSDWLRERSAAMESQPTKKTITKQEILDFIRENQVHVEEVNYTERREFNDNGEVVSDAPIDSTRLEYTTEGLDNKREIALTVPTIEPYNESDNIHFGDAGEGRAVAWVRFGETTDADGKRVLVIDEIQSKRHQDGREKGYQREMTDEERAEFNSLGKEYQATVPALKEKYGPDITDTFRRRWNELTDEDRNSLIRAEEIVSRQHELAEITNGVPEAPFEKNWHELAMKRMLRYAAENGYDKIAWTTGEQQAERYDLSKSFNYASYDKNSGKFFAGNVVDGVIDYNLPVVEENVPQEKLAGYVGKENALRLVEKGSLQGEELRIGGEGMKGFYDQMLPRFMDKYGKKWGVKTGEVVLPGLGDNGMTMWSVDVTPEMRESVMKGQPMFMKMSDKEKEAEYRRLVDIIEKPKRIEKLRTSEPIEVNFSNDYPLERGAAKKWAKENIKGIYTNAETKEEISVSNVSIDKITSHGEREEAHLKAIKVIPQMIENSIFVDEVKNEKENGKYDSYRYYVCGLTIDGDSYTAKVVVGVKNGRRYYDHELTQIEKGELIDSLNGIAKPVAENNAPLSSGYKDKRLLSILQINPEEISRAEERLRELEAGNTESSGNTGNGGQTGRLGVAARSEAVEAARGVGEQLGGIGVEVVLNGEATDADKTLTEEQRLAKGWYDPSTGKVYLNASRIESAEDAVRTVLHEKAGHEGLSALLGGQDGVDRWGDFIFKSADKELRRRMVERADAEGYSMADRLRWSKAAQEVFADIAMEGPKTAEEFSLWRKAKHYIIKALKALRIRVRGMVTDEDLRYYVLKTVEALRGGKAAKDSQRTGEGADLRFSRMPGTPARMEGESDARYFARLREWEQRKLAEEQSREMNDEAPDMTTFEKKYDEEYRRAKEAWDSQVASGITPEGREPDPFDYMKKANDAYREAYKSWQERQYDADEMDADLALYGSATGREEVRQSAKDVTSGPHGEDIEQKMLHDIGEALGADMSVKGVERAVKLSIIERRKNLESASAEDAIYIHDLEKKVTDIAKENSVDSKELLDAIPLLIELPRRLKEIADGINNTLTWKTRGYRPLTEKDIERMSSLLNSVPVELPVSREVGVERTPELVSWAREVAESINAANGVTDRRVTADDIFSALPSFAKRTTGDIPSRVLDIASSPSVRNLISKVNYWYAYFYHWLDSFGMRKQDVGYINDYVNHVWDKEKSDPQAYEQYVENYQRMSSPNMRKREIKTYQEGIDLGLVPKFRSITDLMRYYSRSNNEAVSNKQFVAELSGVMVNERNSKGEVTATVPLMSSKEPSFTLDKYEYFQVPGIGGLWVYKPAASRFSNIFGPLNASGDKSWTKDAWRAYDTAASTAKKIELSFSGFHAGALTEVYLAQNFIRFGPVKSLKNLYKYLIGDTIKTGSLPAYANAEDFRDAAAHLVKLGATDDYAAANVRAITSKIREMLADTQRQLSDKGVLGKVGSAAISPLRVVSTLLDWANKGMDTLLWDYLHDGLKIATYKMYKDSITSEAAKKGWDQKKIDMMLDEVGQYVNDMFGGQYWELINVNPKQLKFFQRVLLSPDWLVSTQRHFFALGGFGSLYNEGGFINYLKYNRDNLKRFVGYKDVAKNDFRAFRSKNAKLCYGIGVMIGYNVVMNAINALIRRLDEEGAKEEADEIRKTNPNYKSRYELAYPDGMKWFDKAHPLRLFGDYGMSGNAAGQQSHLFTGHFNDGSEIYLRWGKQFREFPELWMNHKGEFEFPGPLLQRMKGKANPNVRMLFEIYDYIDEFKAGYRDKQLQEKYGKFVGLLAKTAKNFLPFTVPTQEDKEFIVTDLFFPSGKGFSKWKAKTYFESFAKAGDMDGIALTYKSCILNGLDAEQLLTASLKNLDAVQKKELGDGVKDLQGACERFDASKNLEEKRKMKNKIDKYVASETYKDYTREEALAKVRRWQNGEDVEQGTKVSDLYLEGCNSGDILEDYRIREVKRKSSIYKKNLRDMENNDATAAELQSYERQYQRWFDIIELLDEYDSDIRYLKSELPDGNRRQVMNEIRDRRKTLLKELEKVSDRVF